MHGNFSRRGLFKAGASTAFALGASGAGRNCVAGEDESRPNIFREAAADVPIVDQSDVVVCGAGPAGIAAAIAAARLGAKVRILEVGGCMGGVWTAGLLCWILDMRDKPGILQEIMLDIRRRSAGYTNIPGSSFAYDPEVMKLLLDEMCIDAGIKVQLHTRVVAASKDKRDRLKLAVTESKSGRQAWAGRVFVDATGDGDLAARAGCGFDLGRESDGATQPMSMMAIIAGPEYPKIKQFVRGAESNAVATKQRLLEEMARAGVTPSYSKPTLFRIYDGLYCLASNHEYDCIGTDAADVTEATMNSRAEVHRLVNGLRSLGGAWENVRTVATCEHIGVREGRRIHGLYTVSKKDLIKGTRHEDAICRVYFGVDVHSVKKSEGTGISRTGVRSRAYDVPLRSLIARDVDALLMAGRCISGDFIAHSSYRVTGNSVAMGQAAGVAAALAAADNCLPQDLPWQKVRNSLDKFDAMLE